MTKLLMISGDRSMLRPNHQSAFLLMLEEFRHHFERIDIICPRGIVALHEPRMLHQNVFVHASNSSRLLHPFFIRTKGAELFSRFHHDVMTVHEYPPFLNGIGARMLKREIGIPMVMEIHHIVGCPHAASISEYIGRWMTRMFIASHSRSFDAVRVVNRAVQSQLVSFGVSTEKILVVPSVYLDHAVLDAATNEEKKYDMVFAARLVENKGLMAVIDAVAEMPEKTLLIVGDGPLKKDAEAHVRAHGITSRVTFTGFIPDAVDYAKAVASGRIFLMNSKSEGNPRVAVEAMALGLPIIATKVGIMPDIVKDGENGLFTDGTAVDVTTKAMVLLADLALIQQMGERAREVKNCFEKKSAIKNYAEFLNGIAIR